MNTLTPKTFAEAALRYADSDNTNPTNGLCCHYTDPHDPQRHCLIGQIVLDVCGPVAQSILDACEGTGAYMVLGHFDYPDDDEIVLLANSLQAIADGESPDDPRPWSEAVAEWKPQLEAMAANG